MRHFLVAVLAASACAFTPIVQASCGSAFCSVNPDWAADTLGLAEGSVLDIRYENLRQDQPRAGSNRVGVGSVPRHHDEVRTYNNNLLLNYSQGFASGWGYAVMAPLVDREHLHIHNHNGGQIDEEWKFRELGDIRITGRFQGPVGDQEHGSRSAGVVFGLKLPTGRTGIANGNGDTAERSLQPGSGTTDAVLGAYFHQQFAETGSAWFAQAQVQHPLARHRDFAPGTQWTADAGYSRRLADKLSALLQLNIVVKQRDRGAEAEPDDSGSRGLFLSPGLACEVLGGVRLYGFMQQPLYQHVNGVQLTARRAFVVGLATRF